MRQRCVHELRLFCVAIQFYTRLPIPRWVGFEPDWLQHATRYFPLVGLIVATVTASGYVAASNVWSKEIAVVLSTALGIYMTGAFHEDGFADMCDGMGGGMTADRVLAIMKDSRIGTYGAIGIGLMLALKCLSLSQLPSHAIVLALLIAHPFSRVASCAVIWLMDYARDDSKAKPLAQSMSNAEFFIASVTGCAPMVILALAELILWRNLLWCVLGVLLTTLWLCKKFKRRIGGYTGDCLGAIQQAAEVACYLALLVI